MFRKFAKNEGGSVAVMFGLSLIPMLAAAGAAVDYSRASSSKSQLQAALDAAVLGGIKYPVATRNLEAKKIFTGNIRPDVSTGTPSFTTEPDGTFAGVVDQDVSATIGRILNITSMKVAARSAARLDAVPVPPVPASSSMVCVLVLDTSGTQALLVNSGARVIAPNCEVHVKSTSGPAAIFNAGTTLNAKRFCIEGNSVIQNSTTTNNLELNCRTAGDPFAGNLPAPPSTSCSVASQNYSGTITLNPGVYCGWFNFNGVTDVTFNPGVYVIKNGGWNVGGGSFKGTGVTFYFDDTSKIQFNSGMDTDIEPPSTGTYKGILFYERMGLAKSDFIFNNAVKNRMDGLIYLPSRNVTFNADSKMGNDKTTFVMHRLIWNNVSMKLQPNHDRGITSGAPATTPTPTPVASGSPKLVR